MPVPIFARATIDWFKNRSAQFVDDTAGATAIEYSLIATLISVAIIGGVAAFGSQLNAEWLYVATIVNPQLGH